MLTKARKVTARVEKMRRASGKLRGLPGSRASSQSLACEMATGAAASCGGVPALFDMAENSSSEQNCTSRTRTYIYTVEADEVVA